MEDSIPGINSEPVLGYMAVVPGELEEDDTASEGWKEVGGFCVACNRRYGDIRKYNQHLHKFHGGFDGVLPDLIISNLYSLGLYRSFPDS